MVQRNIMDARDVALLVFIVVTLFAFVNLLFDHQSVLLLGVSVVAGLSTTIGGVLAVAFGKPRDEHLAFVLGMAAGVMCVVSVFDMYIPMIVTYDFFTVTLTLLAGFVCFAVVDRAFLRDLSAYEDPMIVEDPRTFRIGLLTAIVLTIHNLPEGMAVAVSSLSSIRHGLIVSLAICIHNIPEGVVIAAPIYSATNKMGKAVAWTFYSGLSEPVGAVLALGLMKDFMQPAMIEYLLTFIGGIMIGVSVMELLPEAMAYKRSSSLAVGTLFGALIMGVSIYFINSTESLQDEFSEHVVHAGEGE